MHHSLTGVKCIPRMGGHTYVPISIIETDLYSTRSQFESFWQRIFERDKPAQSKCREKSRRRRPPRPSSTFFESDEVAAEKARQKAQIVTALSIFTFLDLRTNVTISLRSPLRLPTTWPRCLSSPLRLPRPSNPRRHWALLFGIFQAPFLRE